MGADRKLFINSSWEPEDIKELLETLPEVSGLQIINSHTPSYVILTFAYDGANGKEERQMNFHYSSKRAGFTGNLITLGIFGSSDTILTTIADRIGGFYEENDCSDKGFVAYDFNVDHNLGFMLRNAVLRGKCDGDNIEDFVKDYKEVTASWKDKNTLKIGGK